MESVRLLRVEGFHKFVEKRPTISIAILNIKIIQIERMFYLSIVPSVFFHCNDNIVYSILESFSSSFSCIKI